MDNVIYVWDPASGEYLDWNGISGSLGSGVVRPFQAFWVKANSNPPTLSVDLDGKTTGGNFAGKDHQKPAAIGFELSADTLTKQMHVTLHPQGSNGKDIRDAFRLLPFNTDTYLELYTTLDNGTELSINNLARSFGAKISVPIHIGGFKGGRPINDAYTLSWPKFGEVPSEWKLTLEDMETGETFNLRETSSVTFNHSQSANKSAKVNTMENFQLINSASSKSKAKASNNTARFKLHIEPGEDAEGLPDKFELYNNFPNPFNPTTNIRFAVPVEGPIELRVYDVLGRQVAELVNERYQAGFHEVKWNANGLSSGSYFLRLKTQNGIFTQKMMLIK
ncbi:MAG: hypothetical protein CL666_05890 [Balneola sp.]|nr:hypothetical protein [Balneola sp.]|tara:strand:+ start:145911 stop:146915 length:1005 start_codon:yes stop_codon:yes gene_type:complete